MYFAAAIQAVNAGLKKSNELGTKMNIAIVDRGGNLVAFAREDGAWVGSVDISVKKAKTATFFDMETQEIGKLSQPGGSLYNIEHSNNGLITFPGGIPLTAPDGTILGGVGVSGSTVKDDKVVAEAAVEGFKTAFVENSAE
jgi:uncharacterized protein GlcG (DUF336 family)